MKLPWQHHDKPTDAQQGATQQAATRNPKDKAVAAQLNASGEAGTLVLSTDNLVKKYRQRNRREPCVHQPASGRDCGSAGTQWRGQDHHVLHDHGTDFAQRGATCSSTTWISPSCLSISRAQLGIGYLPQEASVFRTLSVENNIRTILEMTDTTPQQQADRLEQLISEFHLQKVRHNLGNRLSGGERRRHRDCALPCHQPALYHARRALCGC